MRAETHAFIVYRSNNISENVGYYLIDFYTIRFLLATSRAARSGHFQESKLKVLGEYNWMLPVSFEEWVGDWYYQQMKTQLQFSARNNIMFHTSNIPNLIVKHQSLRFQFKQRNCAYSLTVWSVLPMHELSF